MSVDDIKADKKLVSLNKDFYFRPLIRRKEDRCLSDILTIKKY